jgi:hypothetical protein
MRHALPIFGLSLMALLAPQGVALGQDASHYVYTPPPQQPPIRYQNPNGPAVPAPFGALYNTLNGNFTPQRNGQQPLTPFNTPAQPVVTP